jgi:hypothetical protein
MSKLSTPIVHHEGEDGACGASLLRAKSLAAPGGFGEGVLVPIETLGDLDRHRECFDR